MRAFRWGFLIILLSILAGCAAYQPYGGLFSTGSCRAPCWEGLTPGISTDVQAGQFFGGAQGKGLSVRREVVTEFGCRWWLWDARLSGNGGHVYVKDGKVALIEIVANESTFSFERVLDRFGEPEYAEAMRIIGPEKTLFEQAVYYPSKGLAFHLEPKPEDAQMVRPTTIVRRVYYYQPGDVSRFLALRASCNGGEAAGARYAEQAIQWLQRWETDGKVKVHDVR